MKILVVCDEGNNRSVTIAHHLKYWGHDVLSAGLSTNSEATLNELYEWADRILMTDFSQQLIDTTGATQGKTQMWDVGPDAYPRPFNKKLLAKVRKLMEDHKDEYKA